MGHIDLNIRILSQLWLLLFRVKNYFGFFFFLPPQIRETPSIVLKSADARDRWLYSNPSPPAYLLWDIVPFINVSISPFCFCTMSNNNSIFLKRLIEWFNFTNIYKVLKPCLEYCHRSVRYVNSILLLHFIVTDFFS